MFPQPLLIFLGNHNMSYAHPTKDKAFLENLINAFEQQYKVLNEEERQAVKMIFSYLAGQNQAISENYDAIAHFYDDLLSFMGYQVPAKIAQALTECLNWHHQNLTIFDAGAGTGLLGDFFRKAEFKGRLIGLDISEKSIQYIQKHRSGVYNKAKVGDLTDLSGISDASIDVVASAGVIGIAPPESLDELLRITKPGGLMVYSFNKARYESEPTWEQKHQSFLQQKRWQPIEGYPKTYLYYNNQQLKAPGYFHLFMFEKI